MPHYFPSSWRCKINIATKLSNIFIIDFNKIIIDKFLIIIFNAECLQFLKESRTSEDRYSKFAIKVTMFVQTQLAIDATLSKKVMQIKLNVSLRV